VRFRDGGGVRLQGDIGELWRLGRQVGLVYRWRLAGWEREWRLEAERYKVETAGAGGRDVDLVLDLGIGLLQASGVIWTEFQADGHSHRAMIIKGGALKWGKRAEPAVPAGRQA